MWRLFRVFNKSKKTKAKNMAKEKARELVPVSDEGQEGVAAGGDQEAATVLDDAKESKEQTDTKRAVLHFISEFADLHERIKK